MMTCTKAVSWKVGIAAILLMMSTIASVARAAITLPAIISDHMVLQADRPATIWGWANKGEAITVKFAGQTQRTTVGDDGAWRVQLKPMKPSAQSQPLIVQGATDDKLTINDVLVGQVWLGGGQSNMEFSLEGSRRGKELIASANQPTIRIFHVSNAMAWEPMRDVKGRWQLATPKSVGGFSAVSYDFGLMLHEKLSQPVGLIGSYWGGTRGEAWTPRAPILANRNPPRLHQQIEQIQHQYPDLNNTRFDALERQGRIPSAAYAKEHARWAKQDRSTRGKAPAPPPHNIADPQTSSVLYNAMIAPLTPYTLRGVIWYQGERNANTNHAYEYRYVLPTLIKSWRTAQGRPDLPFYFVQLPNWNARSQPVWAVLRESMLLTWQSVPHTGMAVTIGQGNARNLHPTDKWDVAHRLLLIALAKTYGMKNVVYSGPVYKNMVIQDGKAIVSFTHVDGGLTAKNSASLDGFEIAANNKPFVPAQARIEGSHVIVWSDKVRTPVAVRYAWASPLPTLFNKANLPATPFRTDTRPVVTQTRSAVQL